MASKQTPFEMTEDQIHEKIFETHVHGETPCDVESLFNLAGNILGHSTHIVDGVAQVFQGRKEQDDNTVDKNHAPNFSSPLCILEDISSQMSCKEPDEEISYDTTLAILKKLSHYEWDAKVVLTLAAFAFKYGEFWLLYHLQENVPLAKSLAVLRRVPVLTRQEAIKKHGNDITYLNTVIKKTFQVIELIFELEKLTHKHEIKKVPTLRTVLIQIPIDVFWAIITVVAVVTQMHCLTKDSPQSQELSRYYAKIEMTLGRLGRQLADCKREIREAEYITLIYRYLVRPTEILQLIKLLIFHQTPDKQQQVFDGATNQMVNVDVLERKNIFFFISTLDITDDEISVVTQLYNHISNNDHYKIVWIPIEERWNDAKMKDHYEWKFKDAKAKMQWYVVEHSACKLGCKFIKEEWHFKKLPMVVVMNKQSEVILSDAFHIINSFGISMTFPFNAAILENLHSGSAWVKPVFGSLFTARPDWSKYIFIYGGQDKKWISGEATALAKELARKANISIEYSICVEQQKEGKFWSRIESLFVTKIHMTGKPVTREVQKVFSCRKETGWFLLVKDSSVVLSGRQTTLSMAVSEFQQWEQITDANFQTIFKPHFERIVKNTSCSHLDIPCVSGKLPESIWCTDCGWSMDTHIHYKCCHKKSLISANGA